MNLTITEGSFMKEYDHLMPLFVEHWDEVAKNKNLMKLAPNKRAYQILEDSGALLSLFGYNGDDLVGYSVNIITPHLHYESLVMAQNDIIYVHPSYRNTPLGLRIIKVTEQECAKRGAKLMFMHAKEGSALAKILPRKGYGIQDIIYTKELKE